MAEMLTTQWKIFGVETIFFSETGSKFNIELNMKLSRKLKYTPIICTISFIHNWRNHILQHFLLLKWKQIFTDHIQGLDC